MMEPTEVAQVLSNESIKRFETPTTTLAARMLQAKSRACD